MKNKRNNPDKRFSRKELAERREQRKLIRKQKRDSRIEKAKQTLKKEDRPSRIERAKQILIEEELAEKTDHLREELQHIKDKHREEIKKIRQSEKSNRPPVSERELVKRRERIRHASGHRLKTLALIDLIIGDAIGKEGREVFDILPFDKALSVSPISYGEIADRLNDHNHKTLYGREWTRASVKRLLEIHGGGKYKTIGHKQDKQKAANEQRKKKVDEFAIKMKNEVLPLLDLTATHHEIAQELNKRGIKTRTGGQWVNVSVSRLLNRLKRLEKV